MAVKTKELALGFQAPSFSLFDVISGNEKSLEELKGRNATVVMFICNHCPYVKHVIKTIVQLAKDYLKEDVSFIAISSNDVIKYPADAPEMMKEFARENDFPFPYLFDETQNVARDYVAACTPEFYIFDKKLILGYHGQMDDARPGNNEEVTGIDLSNALESIKSGEEVRGKQKPSIGCGIKWK